MMAGIEGHRRPHAEPRIKRRPTRVEAAQAQLRASLARLEEFRRGLQSTTRKDGPS